jgi:hypothetical protein
VISGNYTGAHTWVSDCCRFTATRLHPASRKWIVAERVDGNIVRWSRSFNDIEAARIDMTARLAEIDEDE